jgi:hypothetical protein
MRKCYLITAVLLLSFAWVVAQTNRTPPPAQDNPSHQADPTAQEKEPATGEHGASRTIEGCISSVAGGFTLTDNSGKTYQLAGDTSKLADQVGHYDQVTGTEEAGAGGAAAAAGGPSTFTVRKVKVVSTTCPTK